MFKAIQLGQWYNLSDPELEYSLITRINFQLFCRFDDFRIPDHSTLCRFRNWLAQNAHECNHLEPLLEGISTDVTVYADKGYDSKANREHLQRKKLSDGIMC